MKNILISLMFVFLFMVVSCGWDDAENFPNKHADLNWSDKSHDTMTWDEAKNYCENLGGRLPTISELRTLIQNCPGAETGGECGITDDCLSYEDCGNDKCGGCEYDYSGKYSVFGDSSRYRSSSEPFDDEGFVLNVDFSYGSVYIHNPDNYLFVRCVH